MIKKIVNIRIDAEVHRRFRKLCISNGETVSGAIKRYIYQQLKEANMLPPESEVKK